MPFSVGVDLGGTKIAAVLVDETLEVISFEKIAVDSSRDVNTVIRQVGDLAARFLEKIPPQEETTGLGLSFPGLLDLERERLVFSENLNWRDIPVGEMIRSVIKTPFFLEHDVRCGAIAELHYGAGKAFQDLVYVSVGTGISGILVWKRRIIRGAHGVSAELGHTVIEPGGPLCRCGNHGCLEALASGSALEREAFHVSRKPVRGEDVLTKARKGEFPFTAIAGRAGYYLALGLANLAEIFDPEVIILGGGVIEAGQFFIDLVCRSLKTHRFGLGTAPRILPGRFKGKASVMGAAAIPLLKREGVL
ncbi:MAG TPA: ROK family protein [Atribacteraceae bacterium]|nr:ROK family protein [Atribacteraceae bacterium]